MATEFRSGLKCLHPLGMTSLNTVSSWTTVPRTFPQTLVSQTLHVPSNHDSIDFLRFMRKKAENRILDNFILILFGSFVTDFDLFSPTVLLKR